MSDRRGVGAVTAVLVMAKLTLMRTRRTGGVWWACGIAFLPVVMAGAVMNSSERGAESFREMFYVMLGLLAIVPALLLGPAIADEKDDKTMTYLWSRPIARWTVLAGKMLTLVPVCAVLVALSVAATFQITWGDSARTDALAYAAGAMALGCLATGSISVALGTLAPKHPMAFTVMYMTVLDVPLGLLPMKLQELSVTHQVTQLARIGDPDPVLPALAWLLGMTAAWLALASWRIRRLE
jgi:ABC-type transport system involved in multi-copper enzyme maturation permease subunit